MPRRRKNERKDGRVMLRLEIGHDSQGKRIRKCFYGTTKEEAQAKLDEYVKNQEAGLAIDADTITVREWAEKWLAAYKATVAYKTRVMYESALNANILPVIGDMLIKDVRPLHIQNLAAGLLGKSKSHISNIRITISQLFSNAVDNGLIIKSPADKATYPKGYAGSHRALERWEIDLISNNWIHHRAGLWAMLMLYAGLRRGEAIALEWKDIDLENNILHIRRGTHFEGNKPVDSSTKTEAGVRDIFIVTPLQRALTSSHAEGNTGKICVSASSLALTDTAFRRGWNGLLLILEKAANNIEPVQTPGKKNRTATEEHKKWITVSFTPHDLRHTYSTMLYDAGVDVKSAQRLLGHTSVQMTMQLYTHLSNEKKEESKKKINEYFAKWDT